MLNGVLDVLRRHDLDWVIARIFDAWASVGLIATIAGDSTEMAARQVLSLANTIDVSLASEVEALAYLHAATPEALFQDGFAPLDSARPIDGADLATSRRFEDSSVRLDNVVTALSLFTGLARDAVREEWPGLQAVSQ